MKTRTLYQIEDNERQPFDDLSNQFMINSNHVNLKAYNKLLAICNNDLFSAADLKLIADSAIDAAVSLDAALQNLTAERNQIISQLKAKNADTDLLQRTQRNYDHMIMNAEARLKQLKGRTTLFIESISNLSAVFDIDFEFNSDDEIKKGA